MAFPDKNWLGFPKGWKDLGKIGYFSENGGIFTRICGVCSKRLRVARDEDGKVFRYCSRCLIKNN